MADLSGARGEWKDDLKEREAAVAKANEGQEGEGEVTLTDHLNKRLLEVRSSTLRSERLTTVTGAYGGAANWTVRHVATFVYYPINPYKPSLATGHWSLVTSHFCSTLVPTGSQTPSLVPTVSQTPSFRIPQFPYTKPIQ